MKPRNRTQNPGTGLRQCKAHPVDGSAASGFGNPYSVVGVKPLDVHPAALEEWKSAVSWYLERNETAAVNFVTEGDQAIDWIAASPGVGQKGLRGTRKFVFEALSVLDCLPRERNGHPSPGYCAWAQATGYWKDRV
jgi:hypothetical protein